MNNKKKALAKYLGVRPKDITACPYHRYLYRQTEYLVLTDRQADSACKTSVIDALWALHYDDIRDYLSASMSEHAWITLSSLGEDADPIIAALLPATRRAELVASVIRSEGRGPILSAYSQLEIALGGGLYAYRLA